MILSERDSEDLIDRKEAFDLLAARYGRRTKNPEHLKALLPARTALASAINDALEVGISMRRIDREAFGGYGGGRVVSEFLGVTEKYEDAA